MFSRMIAPATLMAALMCAPAVRAGEWTTVATACVPDESSAGKYQADFGRFQFVGNNTGTIDARCNLTNPYDSVLASVTWNSMEITYEDPDGPLTGSEVVVTLRKVDKFTGGSTQIASFSSNAYGVGQQLQSAAFAHAFNFTNNAYYVGISVKRGNTFQMPRIQRVRLRTVNP